MSNIGDTNKPDESAEDTRAQAVELSPDVGLAPENTRRPLFVRAAVIAGIAAAVVAVLALTFGAGVWAGSEFGDEYGRDGRGHSESRSHDHDADDAEDIDKREDRVPAEAEHASDYKGTPSNGQSVRPGGERVQVPASSSATAIPEPTASGRS
ncbi:hypothetical protein P5V93_23600 [Mycobacteroides abscessus subsp. abscessus]|uniref:hypothetical protein n=1 Tax=Mycobacteroides abscessus TaxID=36809 RepID=UPI0002E43AFF|nr:hypothetical protein [Mycobacteroides abscessus]MDO3101107.1 hypothetical protein [Mycobacteroides abscessus subsp. abscessus]MDO3185070.1 hypothetical protein [Mycobacteroides abscessus subsp. abscessus]MDO3194306.1 hypothetical protein [Mycobacteroides abscessus subsp. abscessus]MDO3287499.1 hypothetical protein [Mycobacteroides abscessus subsp. abscessus]OLT84782.1 hypothetical protein BKG58_16115 [Mycobacteroides abscessus subsp. abscessus]